MKFEDMRYDITRQHWITFTNLTYWLKIKHLVTESLVEWVSNLKKTSQVCLGLVNFGKNEDLKKGYGIGSQN